MLAYGPRRRVSRRRSRVCRQCICQHRVLRKYVEFSTILGNVEIGEYAKVAAGSVVLTDVSPGKTVAGVPAVEVGDSSKYVPED